MAGLYLVRHGSHALVDKVLLGRSDAAGLSSKGFGEARAMGAALASARIARVQSSPRRRCRETAMVLATTLGVPLIVEPALDELDFGRWSGQSFEDLENDPHWQRWNRSRIGVRPPGGETAEEAQRRILDHIAEAGNRVASQGLVMVTHAEIIRSVILARSGLGLDAWATVTVAPGSIVRVDPEAERMAS
jgi:broad specificity phosphatase PhoE